MCSWLTVAMWLGSLGVAASDVNEPVGSPGVRPRAEDGRPLNLDFESGDLRDWTATGRAFEGQPVHGPIDPNRPFGQDKRSEHTGEHWIGGFEKLGDEPRGTLTSAAFEVTHPYATFLVAGGSHRQTRVELIQAGSGEVFHVVSGRNEEELRPVVVDLQPLRGRKIRVRLVDQRSDGWGHLNFDDFRFHETEPQFRDPERVIRPAPAVESLYPFAGLGATEAAEAMQVPEGFSVQVGAAEPDVKQPIAMALDDRGRVWIAEAYEYPIRAPEGHGKDRILIFEDTDGNGSLDRRTVFAENLNLVSGLEVGFGGVWVGAAPRLLFIPDRNGDDVPDGPPEILLDGWGYEDTHETLNAFIWGPDGWLYGCHGVFTHSRVGKPGTADSQRVPLNAGIWRYHPVRHEFEVFAHGTSNPWGVDFDDYGQAFCTACVIPHLFHVVQGARYERQGGAHFNPHVYDDIKTIAVHRHYVGNQWNDDDRRRSDDLGGGHAHAGAMVYLGGAWPGEYRNQLFMHNIHGNRINVDRLAPLGSGYSGDRAPDFLFTRDQWSQMINLRYGPDGQVWMIDWYDQNQCHRREQELHDRGNGRIYRVAYGNVAPVRADVGRAQDLELVEMQLHENDWFVRHARRQLQERFAAGRLDPEAREALGEMARTSRDDTRQLRALWALHVTGGVPGPVSDALWHADSDRVRAWLIQLSMEQVPPAGDLLSRLEVLASSDPSPVVRLYLASALGRLPADARWTILERLTRHPSDASDHNLPLMYWYAMEPLAEIDPRRALALGLVAGRSIPLLQQYMVRRVGGLDEQRAIGLLVEGLAQAADAETQLIYLRGMNEALRGRRHVADVPEAWETAARAVAGSGDRDVRLQARVLALTFGGDGAAEDLAATAADSGEDPARREVALAALVKSRVPGLAGILLNLLDDSFLRPSAVRGLAVMDDERTAAELIGRYASYPPAMRREVLATLSARPAFAARLLDAVRDERIAARDLTADLVRQLRNLGSESLDRQIDEVWGSVRETAEDRKLAIQRVAELVTSGSHPAPDLELGRALFARTCSQCHTLYGTGGHVGPDLTGGNRANLEYLLSNVIDPSAVMAREYQPTVIQLADGRVVTGIVRQDARDALTIQTAEQTMVVPRDEIDDLRTSDRSMMPDDLLGTLSDHEVRSLVAYLGTSGQNAMLATRDNAASLFDGKSLEGWIGLPELWSVENGEIVGRSGGLERNEFLVSELAVGDFRLTAEVLLRDNEGNSGIQFRSRRMPDRVVAGYQADIGRGWWGKLYEEHGRGLLWDRPGDEHVRPGDWNQYEIIARGSRITTLINGRVCAELDDPRGARRGILALQLHAGQPMEIRFRNLKLEVD